MLRGLMEAFFEEMEDRDNLVEAVTTADLAIHPSTRIVKHPFQENFTVGEMTVERAEIYLCEPIPWPAGTPVPKPGDYGIYWGALFKFKLEGGGYSGIALEEDGWSLAHRLLRNFRTVMKSLQHLAVDVT